MVDTRKLKARIVEVGKTQTQVASEIGISKRMWYDRMQKAQFNSDEIYKLLNVLDIENPIPIFFAD